MKRAWTAVLDVTRRTIWTGIDILLLPALLETRGFPRSRYDPSLRSAGDNILSTLEQACKRNREISTFRLPFSQQFYTHFLSI
jgi:hypothetical protein